MGLQSRWRRNRESWNKRSSSHGATTDLSTLGPASASVLDFTKKNSTPPVLTSLRRTSWAHSKSSIGRPRLAFLGSRHIHRAKLRDCGDFCGDSPYVCTNFGATRNNSPQLANLLTYRALQGFLPSNRQVVKYAQKRLLISRLRVRFPHGSPDPYR